MLYSVFEQKANSRKRVRAFDYVFIYLSTRSWRTFGGRARRQQCAFARRPTMQHPFRGKMTTRTYYIDIKIRCLLCGRGGKRKKANLVKLLFTKGAHWKVSRWNQFSGTTDTRTSLSVYISSRKYTLCRWSTGPLWITKTPLHLAAWFRVCAAPIVFAMLIQPANNKCRI